MAGKQPNAPAPRCCAARPPTGHAVREARLYISALGVYEAHVNGHQVTVPQDDGSTPELLAPGWTNCHSRINYRDSFA
ncbi:alpha-L-rhamnosidase N-terminal domain-containing protein [Streptomyces sp. NPDC048282]|uniref:alpha-L-rhamnosidase N-terminal domain-containing protein n=1 Tax=Streptomyces sp. NPDC048282 TaxID=3365528 RepID=UPI003714816F